MPLRTMYFNTRIRQWPLSVNPETSLYPLNDVRMWTHQCALSLKTGILQCSMFAVISSIGRKCHAGLLATCSESQ